MLYCSRCRILGAESWTVNAGFRGVRGYPGDAIDRGQTPVNGSTQGLESHRHRGLTQFLRPQHICGRVRVLTLVAAPGEEIGPVRVGEAVVALWKPSNLRRPVDARQHAFACLLDLP